MVRFVYFSFLLCGLLLPFYSLGQNKDLIGHYKSGQKKSQGIVDPKNNTVSWKYWYESRKNLGEGKTREGNRIGLWQRWHENGQLQFSGKYVDGLRYGTWKWMNEEGEILVEEHLKGGAVISTKVFTNGKSPQKIKGAHQQFPEFAGDLTLEFGKKLKAVLPKNGFGEFVLSIKVNGQGRLTYVSVIGAGLVGQEKNIEQAVSSLNQWKGGEEHQFPTAFYTDIKVNYFEDGSLVVSDFHWVSVDRILEFEDLNKPKNAQEETFIIVEEMPDFPGGSMALFKFMGANLEYPREAIEQRIEGQVFINFIVFPSGLVGQAKVVREPHPVLGEAALKMVGKMPLWTAGFQRGKPVKVSFNLPVNFKLK